MTVFTVFQITELENRQLPLGFLPHPKSDPRFCLLLFSKVDAEAENEAKAHR